MSDNLPGYIAWIVIVAIVMAYLITVIVWGNDGILDMIKTHKQAQQGRENRKEGKY